MDDQVDDTRIIPSKIYEDVLKASTDIIPMALCPPQVYEGMTGDCCVKCTKSITSDISLKILHGSNLNQWNNFLNVVQENISCPIPGRRVIGFIGGDNKIISGATNRRKGGVK